MQATLHTTMGDIVIVLFPDLAPVAVENFTGLARGTKEYTEPNAKGKVKGKSGKAVPFYDGCRFHDIIPGFIIQGGDPTGSGMGGPGYWFDDELHDLKFDRPFLVATAGRGPKSHGSQFFITLRAADHLDGHHTIFGEVADVISQQVVREINAIRIPRPGQEVEARADRPLPDPVIIQSITVDD